MVRIIIGPADQRFFDGQKFMIKAGEFKEMTGLNEGLAIKSNFLKIFNNLFNLFYAERLQN